MMAQPQFYLIQWNPFPGNFWAPKETTSLSEEQASEYERRGLAFTDWTSAYTRSNMLNDALLPHLGSIQPPQPEPFEEAARVIF